MKYAEISPGKGFNETHNTYIECEKFLHRDPSHHLADFAEKRGIYHPTVCKIENPPTFP